MRPFEGVSLDILHGVAVFTSGLTGHVLHRLKPNSDYAS